MAKVLVTKSKLDALAATISEKSGENLPMSIGGMQRAIREISNQDIDAFFVVIDLYHDEGSFHHVSADKTFQEIYSAVEDGKNIFYFIRSHEIGIDDFFTVYTGSFNCFWQASLNDAYIGFNVFHSGKWYYQLSLFPNNTWGYSESEIIVRGDNISTLNNNKSYLAIAKCSTSGNTVAKTATVDDETWNSNTKKGTYLFVKFNNANTARGNLTLNINSTGNKYIYINGSQASSTNYSLEAGTYLVYYDGYRYYFQTDGFLPGKINEANIAHIDPHGDSFTAAYIHTYDYAKFEVVKENNSWYIESCTYKKQNMSFNDFLTSVYDDPPCFIVAYIFDAVAGPTIRMCDFNIKFNSQSAVVDVVINCNGFVISGNNNKDDWAVTETGGYITLADIPAANGGNF